MKAFSELPRPLIVGSVRQRTAEGAMAEIRAEEEAGARAFILHIQLLEERYRAFEAFKSIAAVSEYPVMAIYYRKEGAPDDDARAEVMREAVRAGCRSVDIPMYLYDDDTHGSLSGCPLPFAAADPDEVSMRPEVIAKQKELIAEFKAMGAEVLMSAHVGVELSREQALALALEIRSRGADIVKIVARCESEEQAVTLLQTNLALKDALDVPFLYTCNKKHNRFTRYNAPLFGSMLVFAHQSYSEISNKEKPLIRDLLKYYEMIGEKK